MKKITKDQFDEMQVGAGILVTEFDPKNPAIDKVICATSGGIQLNITPNLVDTGEDVLMMPPETAEMMVVDGWTVDVSFTALSVGADVINLALGAADGLKPRNTLKGSDFRDLWWIGERVDGGLVAIQFAKALSSDGVAYTTQDKGLGQMEIHITAHPTLETVEEVPVDIYVNEGHPLFAIIDHRYLEVSNVRNYDTFHIDTSTGNLIIERTGEWTYKINNKGIMEVTKE